MVTWVIYLLIRLCIYWWVLVVLFDVPVTPWGRKTVTPNETVTGYTWDNTFPLPSTSDGGNDSLFHQPVSCSRTPTDYRESKPILLTSGPLLPWTGPGVITNYYVGSILRSQVVHKEGSEVTVNLYRGDIHSLYLGWGVPFYSYLSSYIYL